MFHYAFSLSLNSGYQILFYVDLRTQLKFFFFLIECLKISGALNITIKIILAFLCHFCLLLDYDCQTIVWDLTLTAWLYASGFAIRCNMGSHKKQTVVLRYSAS